MHVHLAVIGRLKDGPERQIFTRFAERINKLGRQYNIGPLNLLEHIESKATTRQQRLKQEAQNLLEKLPKSPYIIALDEAGRSLTSRDFSQKIVKLRHDGQTNLIFVIGGPDGLCPSLKDKAAQTLSLSHMTLNHHLARIMLVEQLYRCLTLISGHPYHRD